MNSGRFGRRDLLRFAAIAGAGLGAPSSDAQQPGRSVSGMPFEKKDTVRLGVIGVGGRGGSLVGNFSAVPQVSIAALCDVVKDKALNAQARIERAGRQNYAPALYHSSE